MVYVSSHNIVSSLGFTSSENFNEILINQTGIGEIDNPELSPEPVFVSLTDKEELFETKFQKSEIQQYTDYEKLLITSLKEALVHSKVDIKSAETLLILSTTKGNIDLLQKNKIHSFKPDRIQLWKSSDIIKTYFKHPNQPITISNACISGVLAIIVAKRLLESGKYKHAVVAGADLLPEFTLSGFQAFKAVSEGPCLPFDKSRSGMTPGEGAATLILTTDKKKASKPHIQISGTSCSNDANHISGPSRTGNELALTIQKALEEAHLKTEDIDYISAHGTATPFNDEMESKAFTQLNLNQIPVNSLKGYFGHTFGAAGIMETVVGIHSLQENLLFKSIGFNQQGTESKINVITENQKQKLNHFLKTASGFGGCNATITLSKNTEIIPKRDSKKIQYHQLKTTVLKNNELFFDNKQVTIDNTNSETDFSIFTKTIYKQFGIKYPKFYKMDKLSKLAFLSTELLLKDTDILKRYKADEITVIISNGSSSLITDADYQKTIEDKENYFPSPAVFVYTLANVMVGEICIRHQIKGENTVFISQHFEKDFISEYVDLLFKTKKASVCIWGRIDYEYPSELYNAELYLSEVSK